MKTKKIIVLLIAIIVPLTITTLIGLYAYGTIGEWTGNQEKFVDEIFFADQTNEKSITNYLKFNSQKYNNHTQYMKLYEDYTKEDLKTIEPTNGQFKINGMTFSLYNMLSQEKDYSSFHYDFFYYDIDNTIIDPKNIVIIFVEEESVDSVDNLKLAIDQFQDDFIAEDKPSVYSSTSTQLNANVLFKTGSPLNDVNGQGVQKADGTFTTPYLYASNFLQYQFVIMDEAEGQLVSTKKFTDLSNCSFAMLEVVYDKNNAADTVEVLTTGQITNIKGTADEYVKANPNMQQGYGLDSDKALTNAGYFNFIWPTLLWQTGIAAVVTGIFGFLFYKTWTYEEPNKKQKR